jgi:hypothetical protein
MVRVIIYLLLAAILIGALTLAGSNSAWWDLPTYWIEILIANLFLTLIVYGYLVKVQKHQPQIFTQFYLLSIVVKMLGGLGLITFIVWDQPDAATGNVALFIISYLIFTLLEVINLVIRTPDNTHN